MITITHGPTPFISDNKPVAVIAQTKRGYGSVTIMTDNTWFHRAPTEEELIKLKKEVDDFE